MRLVSKILFIVSAVFLTVGCAALRDPNAVVSMNNDKSKVFVTQADKRAIFTFPNRIAYACPEPSPDVKADVESAIKALLDASANLPNSITPAAKIELDTTRKLITASLLQRSQGLQVLRDMLFQACLANLRSDMDPTQYVNFVTATLPSLTITLITAEMVTKTKTNGDKAVLGGADLKSFLQFVIGNSLR
jgi:hypothetical protein